jgi:hypothetical protein
MLTYVLVRHKVRDYSAWTPVYDTYLPKRLEAGLTEKYLFRGATDTNEVILLFEIKDLSRAKALFESADLRETIQKAGVIDRPDLYFWLSRREFLRKLQVITQNIGPSRVVLGGSVLL